jgi:hypothetical protein
MVFISDSQDYWIDVIHKIASIKNAPLYSDLTLYEQVNNEKQNDNLIDNLGCGSNKGCLFWPSHVRNTNYSLGFISYRKYKNYIKFEASLLLKDNHKPQYAMISFIDLDEHKTNEVKV